MNGPNSLIHSVLMVEQLLSTGGGWQDTLGGLVGGLKLGFSDAQIIPLVTKVQHYDLSPETIKELNQRIVLTFSGKPRLAKNVLQNVLRRWASRTDEIVDSLTELVEGASKVIECLQSGDIERLAYLMSNYWELKKTMAGRRDSGVNPLSIQTVLDVLHGAKSIVGHTVCGAGGGGFIALVTTKHVTKQVFLRLFFIIKP